MRSKFRPFGCGAAAVPFEDFDLEEMRASGDLTAQMAPDAQPESDLIEPEITEEDVRAQEAAAEGSSVFLSDLIERYITIDGSPFRFISQFPGLNGTPVVHDRTYLRGLYDLAAEYPKGSRNILLHCGRQVEKSTSQSAKAITLGAVFPAYKTLYVAPRFDQVSVFSSQRFKPMAEDSEALWSEGFLRPSKTLWQVGAKEFLNRSFYNFRSCYITADGCRGITAQNLLIDELQDIISDNIPVLEECQSHWGWETGLRYRLYAGTPKTSNNPLSRRYKQSSQFEWIIRCSHCKYDNFPDEHIVGAKFYICTRPGCGRQIHMSDGRWVPMNPAALDTCWGFRISQMMVPFKTHADILSKIEDPNISRLKLFNETFGLPYDEGELILTEEIMQRASDPKRGNQTPAQIRLIANSGVPVFAGIDHGSGEGDSPSFTVLAMGTMDATGMLSIRHIIKFTGRLAALAPQTGLLNQMMRDAGVTLAFSDWGFGAQQNARLWSNEFGWSRGRGKHMLGEVQYCSQRQLAVFDPIAGRYKVDRNQSMIATIDDIKKQRIQFFRKEEMVPFVQDFVTIFVEYNETYGTTKFDHKDPDDCFHAVNLCRLAALTHRGVLVPTQVPNIAGIDPGDLGY